MSKCQLDLCDFNWQVFRFLGEIQAQFYMGCVLPLFKTLQSTVWNMRERVMFLHSLRWSMKARFKCVRTLPLRWSMRSWIGVVCSWHCLEQNLAKHNRCRRCSFSFTAVCSASGLCSFRADCQMDAVFCALATQSEFRMSFDVVFRCPQIEYRR